MFIINLRRLASLRLLFTLADLAVIDYGVVCVGDAVNANRTKGERLKLHGGTSDTIIVIVASPRIPRVSETPQEVLGLGYRRSE